MRGFPLLNFLITVFLSGAVVLPLVHRATNVEHRALAPLARDTASANPQATHAHLSLRFVHAPQSVRLLSGANVVREWTIKNQELWLEDSVSLSPVNRRVELHLEVRWPAGTPDTNLEIRIEPDNLPSRSAIVWSSGETADEIVAFSWNAGPE